MKTQEYIITRKAQPAGKKARNQEVLKEITQWLSQHPQDVRFSLKPIYDVAGRFIDFVFTKVNTATCVMMGEPKKILLGQEFLKVLNINPSHSFYRKYLKVCNTSQPFIEMFPCPLEQKKWISHLIIKMQDEINVVINFINLTRTPQPWYDENERTSKELTQTVSLSGKILEMNSISRLYFDSVRFEQGALFMDNLLHPMSKLAYKMAVKRVISHKVENSLPLVFTTKDGYFMKVRGVLVPGYTNQKIQNISQSFQIENIASSLNDISAYARQEAFNVF